MRNRSVVALALLALVSGCATPQMSPEVRERWSRLNAQRCEELNNRIAGDLRVSDRLDLGLSGGAKGYGLGGIPVMVLERWLRECE